jgi:hypothetical protein
MPRARSRIACRIRRLCFRSTTDLQPAGHDKRPCVLDCGPAANGNEVQKKCRSLTWCHSYHHKAREFRFAKACQRPCGATARSRPPQALARCACRPPGRRAQQSTRATSPRPRRLLTAFNTSVCPKCGASCPVDQKEPLRLSRPLGSPRFA